MKKIILIALTIYPIAIVVAQVAKFPAMGACSRMKPPEFVDDHEIFTSDPVCTMDSALSGITGLVATANGYAVVVKPESQLIQRVYVFHWNGRNASWDSALISPNGTARPAFAVLANLLRHLRR